MNDWIGPAIVMVFIVAFSGAAIFMGYMNGGRSEPPSDPNVATYETGRGPIHFETQASNALPSIAEMRAESSRLAIAAKAALPCHDLRCPAYGKHRCHNLDCKQHGALP